MSLILLVLYAKGDDIKMNHDLIKMSIDSMKEIVAIIKKLEKYDVDIDIKFPVMGQVETISTKDSKEGSDIKTSIINYYYSIVNDMKNVILDHIDEEINEEEE